MERGRDRLNEIEPAFASKTSFKMISQRRLALRVPACLKGQHRAVYVIGRINIAWGLIEQRVYSDIVRFQQAKNKNLYPHEAEVASTFDDRIKQWRKLCASITSKLSAIDRVLLKIKRLSLVRHHIAHGYPIYFPGFANVEQMPSEPFLHIVEHRETRARLMRIGLGSFPPEILEPRWRQFGIPYGVLDVLVTEVRLQGARRW